MPWDRSIDLFVNVGTAPEFVLLASRSSLLPAERPVLVSGDKHTVRVWLLKQATPGAVPAILSLAAGEQLILAGKTSSAAASLLFSAANFEEVNDADGLHYEGTLDLTSQALRDAFGTNGSIGAVCDIEVQNAANTARRTRQFSVRINQGVYTNEVDPTPAEPAYPAPGALLTSGADTANIKRGTKQLGADDFEAVAVEFDTAFAAAPTTVHVWLMKKAGAVALSVTLNWDTITAEGFTVDLGDNVPDDAELGDYRIGWLAIL